MKKKTLFKNKWLRVVEFDGWFIASEPAQSKNNMAVAVLPYRKIGGVIEYLARWELNPAHQEHSNKEHQMSIITGACETGNPLHHAKMELLEEAGYDIPEDRFKSHGIVCPLKASATRLHIYSVRILQKDKQLDYRGDGNADTDDEYGDGSKHESKEYAGWVSYDDIIWAKDPYIHTIMMRM